MWEGARRLKRMRICWKRNTSYQQLEVEEKARILGGNIVNDTIEETDDDECLLDVIHLLSSIA